MASPDSQLCSEVLIHLAELLHVGLKDLLLDGFGWVIVLHGPVEAVKECFVEDVGVCETSGLGALTFGVGSSENVETSSGLHELTDLLEEHTLAFQHGLKARHQFATIVDLVEKQHSAGLHRTHNRSIRPHGLTVDQTETTEQVVLISLGSDVDTIQFTTELGTCLLDHRGLTVTSIAGDVNRSEQT